MASKKLPYKDLTGDRYGQLVVLGYADFDGTKHRWRVKCSCGTETVARGNSLRSGISTSCGCRKRGAGAENLTTHGLSQTRAHGIWKAAKQRCFNPNAHNYRHYGGRGITMCDRWRDSFQAFFDDMGECPPSLTLERIDNEGNYAPGNCRWATQAEQTLNTRRSIRRPNDPHTPAPATA